MATEATAERVRAFLERVKQFELWIDGGWGVDALLGKQTRAHSDLDLIISDTTLAALEAHLLQAGFKRIPLDGIVFEAPDGLRIDIHQVSFDDAGWGSFDLSDGREWPFPPSAFAGQGHVHGKPVRCLSPEAQVQCHGQGYVPQPKDLADMQALQKRFGLVLPLSLGVRAKPR